MDVIRRYLVDIWAAHCISVLSGSNQRTEAMNICWSIHANATTFTIMPPEAGGGVRRMAWRCSVEICAPQAVGVQHSQEAADLFQVRPQVAHPAKSLCVESFEFISDASRTL